LYRDVLRAAGPGKRQRELMRSEEVGEQAAEDWRRRGEGR
jgi:hypothetical protein